MIKGFEVGKYYYIKKEHAAKVRKIAKGTFRTGRSFVELLIDSPSKCVIREINPCDCLFDNEFDNSKSHRCFLDFLSFIDEIIEYQKQ